MRTFIIIFATISVIGVGLFLKHKGIIFSDSKTENNKLIDRVKWLKKLPGKWKLMEVYSNKRERLIIEGQIQFLENQEFKLNASANFFNSSNNHLLSTYGGTTKGQWQLTDSVIELYNLSECKIKESFRQFNNSTSFDGCKYFEGVKYGNIDTDTQTEIKKISKTEITIEGKRYKDDSKYTCILKRL